MSVRMSLLCGLSAVLFMGALPASAQSPWETAPAPDTAATPSTEAPSAAAEPAPGWLVRIRPRNGESVTDLNHGVINTFVSADGTLKGNTHLALFVGEKLYVPVVYEASGELNVPADGDYTFRLRTRLDEGDGRYMATLHDRICGLSLELNGKPLFEAKPYPFDIEADRKPVGVDVTTDAVHLPAGRYPARWTVSCSSESAGMERERYQNGKPNLYDITTQLQISSDGTTFGPLPAGMALHDKTQEPPAARTARHLGNPVTLQDGYVHGWNVTVYQEPDHSRDAPASSQPATEKVGSGVVRSAHLSSTVLQPVAGSYADTAKGMLANFTATTNLMITEPGTYTFLLKGQGDAVFYGNKRCLVNLTAGPAGTVFDEPLVFDRYSGMIIGNGVELTEGAYPLSLSVACSQVQGPLNKPVVDFGLMVVRPGSNQPEEIALDELVTAAQP